MKYIINLKTKQKLELNDIQTKMRSARNTNDYILVNFGGKGNFMKLSFQKDMTYTFGHNIWNMEFWTKLKIMERQYTISNVNVLSQFLTTWVNRLNI